MTPPFWWRLFKIWPSEGKLFSISKVKTGHHDSIQCDVVGCGIDPLTRNAQYICSQSVVSVWRLTLDPQSWGKSQLIQESILFLRRHIFLFYASFFTLNVFFELKSIKLLLEFIQWSKFRFHANIKATDTTNVFGRSLLRLLREERKISGCLRLFN